MSTEQAKLEYITSAELMEMQLPPIKYTVEEILPAGLTVFAGAPKVGKSLLWLSALVSKPQDMGNRPFYWTARHIQ